VNSDLRAAVRRPDRRRLVTMLVSIALAAAACSPAASPTAPFYTEVPIGPTALPAGTVGQYGLQLDSTLLGKLPATVDAYPIAEDPDGESQALGDPDLVKTFDRYAAGKIGEISDDNWLVLTVAHLQPNAGANAYPGWVDDFAASACSQASGVATTDTATINFWQVDTATCAGGPIVYTLELQNDLVLSMVGYGPRNLGRQLINAIYN
jgi:hypothetical protein